MRTAIRTTAEIAAIRRSGEAAAKILGELIAFVKPGVTTASLERAARASIAAAGAAPAFLGYNGFPAVLCASVNAVAVHGVPSDLPLRSGDILGLDFGVVVDGWYSDVAVTIPVGAISEEARRLLAVTREALSAGIEAARLGSRIGDISAAIQRTVETAGFEVIRELTGHGIGRMLHESPQVPNVGKAGTGAELLEGMVLAIEPITAISAKHVRLAKDGFSYETDDGSLAAHFEHTVAITRQGPEILTLLPGAH